MAVSEFEHPGSGIRFVARLESRAGEFPRLYVLLPIRSVAHEMDHALSLDKPVQHLLDSHRRRSLIAGIDSSDISSRGHDVLHLGRGAPQWHGKTEPGVRATWARDGKHRGREVYD